MDEIIILRAIPSTEEASFGEFCNNLGSDKPENKSEWAQLFRQLDKLETDDLIEIERAGRNIDTLILTEAGAAKVRASYK